MLVSAVSSDAERLIVTKDTFVLLAPLLMLIPVVLPSGCHTGARESGTSNIGSDWLNAFRFADQSPTFVAIMRYVSDTRGFVGLKSKRERSFASGYVKLPGILPLVPARENFAFAAISSGSENRISNPFELIATLWLGGIFVISVSPIFSRTGDVPSSSRTESGVRVLPNAIPEISGLSPVFHFPSAISNIPVLDQIAGWLKEFAEMPHTVIWLMSNDERVCAKDRRYPRMYPVMFHGRVVAFVMALPLATFSSTVERTVMESSRNCDRPTWWLAAVTLEGMANRIVTSDMHKAPHWFPWRTK